MPTEPVLSILIPYYNKKEPLSGLLESIFVQSMKPLEVIIVDDGAQESCREIVDAYRGNGLDIRLIEHGINRGTKEARLTGLEQARGRIIAFADSDDLFLGTDLLEQHVCLLLSEEADIVHFGAVSRNTETAQTTFHSWAKAFAPALNGSDIFAMYVQEFKGWNVWGKLYSKDLCLSCMSAARSLPIKRRVEDFFLASLFFSQSQRYRGTDSIGYYYNMTADTTVNTRTAGIIINYYAISEWFAEWLVKIQVSSQTIVVFNANIINKILWEAYRLDKACRSSKIYDFDHRAFLSLSSNIDFTTLSYVLEQVLEKCTLVSDVKESIQSLHHEITKNYLIHSCIDTIKFEKLY